MLHDYNDLPVYMKEIVINFFIKLVGKDMHNAHTMLSVNHYKKWQGNPNVRE